MLIRTSTTKCNSLYTIFKPKTIKFVKSLSQKYYIPEKDLYTIAFIVKKKCEQCFQGSDFQFLLYFHKALQNEIISALRKKEIETVDIDGDIEQFGYTQAYNDEYNDIKNFVNKNCDDNRAKKIFNLYLDQPKLFRYYCIQQRNRTQSEAQLITEYLLQHEKIYISQGVFNQMKEKLKDVKRKYDNS